MALDFNEANGDRNAESLQRALRGVFYNNPSALPDLRVPAVIKRRALREFGYRKPSGMLLDDIPIFTMPPEFRDAVNVVGQKLVCALHFKETGRIIPKGQLIAIYPFQLQHQATTKTIAAIVKTLPGLTLGTRSNIPEYRDRFGYRWGANSAEALFACAAQFGDGLAILGISFPPDAKVQSSLLKDAIPL